MALGDLLLRTRTLALASAALLSVSGCFDSRESGEMSSPPPAARFDARGQRWELRRRVSAFAEGEPRSPRDVEAESTATASRWQDLSDELAAQRLRPITLTPDNYEYTLGEPEALQFVQQLRRAAASLPRSALMSTLDTESLPSGRSRRVLSEDRFPTQLFGEDERVNMNSAAGEAPWSFIAAMSNAGQCTAFKLLNKHTAVTAAHCVHDGKQWHRRKTLQFAAGSQAARAELDANCYSITVAGGWDGEDAEYDFAVIRLREDGLDNGASCALEDYDVGHFGYELVDECIVDVALNLAGYPSQRDPDNSPPKGEWSYPSLFTDYRGDGWTACAGLYPSALWFYNDGSNGQSGSPVWTFHQDSGQNQVRGIYRGSMITVVGDSNRARRFDDSLIAWLTLNAGH